MRNITDLGGLYNSAVLMVLILDGSSERKPHVWSELDNLTCLRHFTSSNSIHTKIPAFLHMCAECSESPSDISRKVVLNCVYQI